MGSNTGSESARSAGRRNLWGHPKPVDLSPQCVTERLTRRAALTVVLLLSLGLWAAIWTAVASLASAVFAWRKSPPFQRILLPFNRSVSHKRVNRRDASQFICRQPHGDTVACKTVPIWIFDPAHPTIRLRIVEQRLHFVEQPPVIGSDQLGQAEFHGFGPLGRIASDQNRFSKGGRLLLNSARIGNDEVTPL